MAAFGFSRKAGGLGFKSPRVHVCPRGVVRPIILDFRGEEPRVHEVFAENIQGHGFKSRRGHFFYKPLYKPLYIRQKSQNKDEKKLKTLEKEGPDALEMAAQANEEREEKKD
jgi:hypothetical protein